MLREADWLSMVINPQSGINLFVLFCENLNKHFGQKKERKIPNLQGTRSHLWCPLYGHNTRIMHPTVHFSMIGSSRPSDTWCIIRPKWKEGLVTVSARQHLRSVVKTCRINFVPEIWFHQSQFLLLHFEWSLFVLRFQVSRIACVNLVHMFLFPHHHQPLFWTYCVVTAKGKQLVSWTAATPTS